MNEIETLRWQLEGYRAEFCRQIDRLYNALEELRRFSLMLLDTTPEESGAIEQWLSEEGFAVDEDNFFQSIPLLSAYRSGVASAASVSLSWSKDLVSEREARYRLFCHRNIGSFLKDIHDRLGDIGWIYYQDCKNVSLQYPFIDQKTAISYDFDWQSYHTYISVSPASNPQRLIRWTAPSVDYAGEGIIISVSIPLWQREKFIGLWSIDLPLRSLYRDFGKFPVVSRQEQFIVGSDRKLILHERMCLELHQQKGRLLQHSLDELGEQWAEIDMESLISAGQGEVSLLQDGHEWRYCYCHVPGVEWLIFSGLPQEAMEEAAAKRLQQAFRKIAEGDFSYRIRASFHGELPLLQDASFSIMTLIEECDRMSERLSQEEEYRQKMEVQLRQAQKMEAVGRLAGGVAHDYNNMLSIIIGYTEMAFENEYLHDSLRLALEEIMAAALRSKELTRQLLAFARCQSVVPKVFDINDAVSKVVRMLQPLLGEDIEVLWQPGTDVRRVCLDPSQFDQILTNLCVNCRDAIQGVGQITVETANITLDADYCALHQGFHPGDFVQLTVSDTGEGIAQEDIERIFDPFFTTKEMGQGTGLGLATVYGIVKQNNGFINVYSEVGLGTLFKIYLPRATDQPEILPTGSAAEILGSGERILLVEDDEAILALLEKMLGNLGYHVLVASSPQQALTIARTSTDNIDVVLSDVIMPEMNGWELVRALRQECNGIKVLFMSGYTANVIEQRGFLNEDAILLQKPFSKEELGRKLREILGAPEGG